MAKKKLQRTITNVDLHAELVALKRLLVLRLRLDGVSPTLIGQVLEVDQSVASRLTPGFKKSKP